LGRDEELQIEIQGAIERHRGYFREAWHNSEYTKAHDYWDDYMLLRRIHGESTDSEGESVRVA